MALGSPWVLCVDSGINDTVQAHSEGPRTHHCKAHPEDLANTGGSTAGQ